MLSRLLLLSLILLSFCSSAFAQADCSSAPIPRLHTGMIAQNSGGRSINLRAATDTDASKLGQIDADAQVTVLSDASCADGYNWFQVDYQGLIGWTAEGAEGEYWLTPVLSSGQIISPDNIAQLQVIDEFICPEGEYATPITWSPDARLLWSCQYASINLTDLTTKETLELENPQTASNSFFAAFSSDGKTLIAYQYSYNKVFYWDLTTGKLISKASFQGGLLAVYGDILAHGSEDKLEFLDLLTLEAVETIEHDEFGHLNSLDFSPDGKYLAFGSWNDTTRILNIETGEILLTSLTDRPLNLRYSPSGRYILGAFCIIPNQGNCDKANMQWIDATTGKTVTTWKQDDWEEIYDIVFGEDLVFIRDGLSLQAIQISTDERIYQNEARVLDVLLSPDGRLLLTGENNHLRIYGVP